ncbi:unnamed protein product [Camellia sinensis]
MRWSEGIHQAIEAKEGVKIEKQQKHNFHVITVITLLLSGLMRPGKKLKETWPDMNTVGRIFFLLYQ